MSIKMVSILERRLDILRPTRSHYIQRTWLRFGVTLFYGTGTHVMARVPVDFHPVDLGPQLRLPETELALRSLGSQLITPWRVEQAADLSSREFLSQYVFSFSPL
jgi:hypothetical protein